MESRSYKELQALAKLHGIRANLSKAALIDKLGSLGDELHQNAQDSSSRSQDNAEKHQADSDAPERNSGKPRDEADTPTNDSDTPEGNANQTRLVDSEPQDAETVPCTATADAAHDRVDDTDVALPDPVKPEVPVENSERRQSERPSTAKKEGPTPVDPVETEVPVESSARRKSDRLSAAAKKESHTASESPRKAKPETKMKTKVQQPTAGPSLIFERMQQNLFAAQASIETYGKTPKKKKKVPAKENVPLSKVTPVRPVGFGSGAKSARRGLTVASKPCTLVVQRSSKKPTQIKEFRLSSNQSGKREPFKPYSGPVRPLNLANKGDSFNVGSSSSASSQVGIPQKNKTKLGIKATLASGKAKSARKNAHVQSSKLHRERVVTEARVGRP